MSTPRVTFADQYKAAGLDPSAEIIQARQESFDKMRTALDKAKILDLTRLYFSLPLPADASWFRDGFAESDKSFSLIDNTREAAFLASCLLSAALEDGKVVAGLAPLSAAAGKTRTPAICPAFLVEARERLADQAIAARQHPVSSASNITIPPKKDVAPLAENEWAKASELFRTINNNSADGLTSLAKQVQIVISSLTGELKDLREEADMLWWYVGAWNRIFDRPFSEFGPPLVAVLAGLDLARLVRTALGPVSAPAILHKLIHGALNQPPAEVTLQDAVDAIAPGEIPRLKLDAILKTVPDLCPVLTAFSKAEEIGLSPHWHAAFRKASVMDATASFGLLDLSVQVYREALLMKQLA